MSTACDTPIHRQGAAFALRERNETPIFLCTNENAQLQSAGTMGQLAATNWSQPYELRPSTSYWLLEAVDWLVKLPPIGCVQLSLTRLNAFNIGEFRRRTRFKNLVFLLSSYRIISVEVFHRNNGHTHTTKIPIFQTVSCHYCSTFIAQVCDESQISLSQC